MKKLSLLFSLLVSTLLTVAFAVGCGSQTKGVGSNTNWYRVCESDAECDARTSCIDAVCTTECDSESSCERLPEATCVALEEVVSTPGALSPAHVCVSQCRDNLACPSAQRCVDGRCAIVSENTCRPVLSATIRDFRATHSEFGSFSTSETRVCGYLAPALDEEGKPYLASISGSGIPSGAPEICIANDSLEPRWSELGALAELYRDSPESNRAFVHEIALEEDEGVWRFDSDVFFPANGLGFESDDGTNHLFTTQIHLEFEYLGGQYLELETNHELWIFVNGELAIDGGGLGQTQSGRLEFDQLAELHGIGEFDVYELDLFLAERWAPDSSSLKLTTNVHCFFSNKDP